jgi:tetratricopeptide (TPR) repeat protein
LQKTDLAREYYKKATRIEPEYADAWFGIAVTLEQEDRWYESIHFIKKALEIDDQNYEYWYALGDSYRKFKNYEDAGKCYERALEIEIDDIELWIDTANMFAEEQKFEDAATLLQIGLKHHPDCSEFYYELTIIYYLKGDRLQALENLHFGLSLNFERHEILFESLPLLQNDQALLEVIDLYRKD